MRWYEILKAARRLCPEESGPGFTSKELALEAGIQPSPNSTAHKIAAAWCSKFVRWGYSKHAGKRRENDYGRLSTLYTMTRWGIRFGVSQKVLKMPERLKKIANPRRKGKEGR